MPAKIVNNLNHSLQTFLWSYEKTIHHFLRHIWEKTSLGGYLRGLAHKPATYSELSPERIRCLSMKVVNSLNEKLFKAIPAECFSPRQCAKFGEAQLLSLISSGTLHKVVAHLSLKELAFTFKQPSVPHTIVPLLTKKRLEDLLESKFDVGTEIQLGLTRDAERVCECWQKFVGRENLRPDSSKVHALMLRIVNSSDCPQLTATLTVDQVRTALIHSPSPELIKRFARHIPVEKLLTLINSVSSVQDPCFIPLCRMMEQLGHPLVSALPPLAEGLELSTLSFFLQFSPCAPMAKEISHEKLLAHLQQCPEEKLQQPLSEALTIKQYVSLILHDRNCDQKIAKLLSCLSKERHQAISQGLSGHSLTTAFLPRLFTRFQKLDQKHLFTALSQQWTDPELVEALEVISNFNPELALQVWKSPIAHTLPVDRFARLIPLMSRLPKGITASFLPKLPQEYAKRIFASLTSSESLLFWFSCFNGNPLYPEMAVQLQDRQLLDLRSACQNPEAVELFALGFAGKEDVVSLQQLCSGLGLDVQEQPLCVRLAKDLNKYSDRKLKHLFSSCTAGFVQSAIDQLKSVLDERVERHLLQDHPNLAAAFSQNSLSIEHRAWLFDRWISKQPSDSLKGILYQLNDPLELLSACKPLSADQLRFLALSPQIPRQLEIKAQLAARADRAQVANVIRLLPLLDVPIPHRQQIIVAIPTMSPLQIRHSLHTVLLANEFIAIGQQIFSSDNSEWFGQWSAILEGMGPFPDEFWREYLKQRPGQEIDARMCAGLLLKMNPHSHSEFLRQLTCQEISRGQLMEAIIRWSLLLNQSDDIALTAFLEALKRSDYKTVEYLPLFDDKPLYFSASSQKVLQKLWEENIAHFKHWKRKSLESEIIICDIVELMNNTPYKHLKPAVREDIQNKLASIMPNLDYQEVRSGIVGLHFLARVQNLLALPINQQQAPSKVWNPFSIFGRSQQENAQSIRKLEPQIGARLANLDAFYQARLKEQQERLGDLEGEKPDTLTYAYLHSKNIMIQIRSQVLQLKYIWKTFKLTEAQKNCLNEDLTELQDLKRCCHITPLDTVDTILEKIIAYTLRHPKH